MITFSNGSLNLSVKYSIFKELLFFLKILNVDAKNKYFRACYAQK